MKKVFVLALIAIISSFALSANTRKQIRFVDENGALRTDITGVTIFTVDTETASSLYTSTTNTTSMTNPITTTSTNTGINASAGLVEFWSEANTFDMNVTIGGTTFKFYDVTTPDRQFMIPRVQSPGRTVEDATASEVWVATTGSDTSGNGSFNNPYLTITQALSVATATRNTVLVMPGSYVNLQIIGWPSISGIVLKAPYSNVIMDGPTVALRISPTYTTAAFAATIENIKFVCTTTQKALEILNTNITQTLQINLKNVEFYGPATTTAVSVAHANADNAIYVYAEGRGEAWGGAVTFACANAGDRLRIKNHALVGGITVTGAVAGEIFLQNTGILTSGITVNGANKLTTIGCWYQTNADPPVYTNCANAFATY